MLGLLAYRRWARRWCSSARKPIRSRDLHDAPVALAAAAAGVCFIVVSTLFDVMSFPHVPYIFLWMAGLLAVITTQPRPEPEPEPEPAPLAEPAVTRERVLEPAWSS